MSLALRGLTGQQVRVVLQDGSSLTGRLATVDDRFNVGIQGARDSALAGTPLETASADSIRIVRGGDVLAVFAA